LSALTRVDAVAYCVAVYYAFACRSTDAVAVRATFVAALFRATKRATWVAPAVHGVITNL
jgi:hypothetical protein